MKFYYRDNILRAKQNKIAETLRKEQGLSNTPGNLWELQKEYNKLQLKANKLDKEFKEIVK